VNVTTPPATGSLLASLATVTTSGAEKAVPIAVLWLLPLETETVKPLDSKAPISTVPLTMRG